MIEDFANMVREKLLVVDGRITVTKTHDLMFCSLIFSGNHVVR